MEKINMDMNKKWHQNAMNLLLGKTVCGVCLNIDDDLVQWEDLFVFEHDDLNVESSLRQIMISTFSLSVMENVCTTKFCQKCIDEIIKAFIFIHRIRENYKHIEQRLTEISEQMKWTEYLDESGSLCEAKINLVNLDEINNTEAKKEDEKQRDNTNSNMSSSIKKTHKIYLNNESLKTKLIQDPQMHQFLFTKEAQKETKLPAGITVRKIKKCLDMAVVAPHELLELNWAQDTDYDTIIPNTQLSKNKLHSNEALIMDLMEKAKTNKHQTNTPQNLNKIEISTINIEDSLTVKLLQRPNSNNGTDNSDDNDIVPQDLLELKWPDDEMCNAKNCMKIPVKKLNFNEALTVKYIPGQNSNKHQEIDSDIAPHELLELSWNDDPDKVDTENTYLLDTEQKHNIDLTKWLQDQGLSTIKTNVLENKKQNMNIQTVCEDEIIKINPPKVTDTVKDNHHFETEENTSVNVTLDCNDDVEITAKSVPHREDIDYLRCALCSLTFEQFEPYSNHYKTHGITEVAKCYRCPTEFPIIEFLSEHLLVIHSENVAYCTVCFALLNQENLAVHMSTKHAARVNIINFPKENTPTVNSELKMDEYCKICKQPLNMPTSGPHTCIDKDSRCSECKQACIHEKYLTSYRDQLRAKKRTFKCTDCKFKYKTKYDIIKHSNKVHLKHKPYRCKVCNIKFLLKSSLGKHNNLSHARCHTCRRVFEDQSSLSKHRCKAEAAGVTKCELCGQRFSESKCKQHKESALAVTDVCVICQRIVPVKCNMVRHMEYVHNLSLKKNAADSTIYECVICEREFKDHKEFFEHSWVHTGVHECHVCAKRFTSKTLYESHYQMHLAKQCDKLHVCSVCGDQVKGKHALGQHMQAHSDYEKCLVCSKYIEKTSLSSHIDEHGFSESKFKCPHCPLICNTHSQFEVHVNRFHLHHRPYQCDTCKKSFYCKRLLRQHMNIHNKLKCQFCERMFARKRDLDIHVRTH